MIARLATVALSLALAGCYYNASRASVSKVCPGGVQRINLELAKATNEWRFSAHAGGFGNIVEHYHFLIPSVPAQRRTYGIAELKLEDARSLTKDIPPLAAGEIVLDPQKNEAVVSITTAGGGAFPGNGTYPLSYLSFDSSDWPKAEMFAGSCGKPKAAG